MVVDGVRSSQAGNGSLVLQHIKAEDAGWYLCKAANTVGKPISKVVQLTVRGTWRASGKKLYLVHKFLDSFDF